MDDQYTSGCLSKFDYTWQQITSLVQIKQPIYPLEPITPPYSEFFVIDRRTRLRIIHVAPETYNPRNCNIEIFTNSKRNSLSEEYWFTKWNRSLKIGNCNCSFRRSFRLSLISNRSLRSQRDNTRESVADYELPPKRIINIETFVERLVQETIFEAFQECYMLKCRNKGVVNYAFDKTNDDEITLRRNITNCITKQPKKAPCSHKKRNERKPLIILLHGIGKSADIWWPIINCLVNKGYEIIAPDMLGHGYSSTPDKSNLYTFENLLIHIITIFDHYLTDESRKCILIGHSYGCSLVTALYRHRASQISQLILISGGGPTPLAAPVKNNDISPFGCVHTLFKPLILCGMKRSFLFSSRGKHFDICDNDTAIPKQILNYLLNGQNWPDGDAAFHRRVLVPTLLVHGLQDKKITLVQQCEMERTIPRAFLELIPNAGHMAMLETPEHLSHMILCFIDTWN